MSRQIFVLFAGVLLLSAISGWATVVLDEDFDDGLMPPGFLALEGTVSVDPYGDGYALHFPDTGRACLELPSWYPRNEDLVIVVDGTIMSGYDGDFWVAYYDQTTTACNPLNGYRADLFPVGSDGPNYRIDKFVNGEMTILDLYPSEITAGQEFHAEYQYLANGHIKVYVDGDLKLDAVDSHFWFGLISLRSWDEVWADNLRVCVGPDAVAQCRGIVYPTSMTVSGPATVPENSGAQYTATVYWSDGSTTNQTSSSSWSENSSYASISSSGYLTTYQVSNNQALTISCSYSSGGHTVSDTHAVTITNTAAYPTDLTITGPATVPENSGAQYTATVYWSDGSTTNQTSSSSWSENSSYASISSSGYLTTYQVSSNLAVTISCSYSSGGHTVSDTHTVTIINNGGSGSCTDDLQHGVVCLLNNRFEFHMTWTGFDGVTQPVVFGRYSGQTATGVFQNNPSDITTVVKVTNGCSFNNHYWVWLGGFTNAAWRLEVTDTQTGRYHVYTKPLSSTPPQTVKDEISFPCP